MKNIIKILLYLALISVFSLMGYMLYNADVSIESIDEQVLKNTHYRPSIYLVSYADGDKVFYQNQHALTASAQNKGFDFFLNYRRHHLDDNFIKHHQEIFSVKAGAGLWLWKPYIILKTLENAPENSIIFYADSGYMYIRPIENALQYVQGKFDVALMNIDEYHNCGTLKEWVPAKIWEEFGYEKVKIEKRPKFIEANHMIIKNTSKARQLIKEWLDICTKKEYMLLKFDPLKDGIRGYTYDQSLLSFIAHKHLDHVNIIPKAEFKRFTVFHHRHPGNNKPLLPLRVLPLKQIREWFEIHFPKLF